MAHRYSLAEDERPSDGVIFAMAEVTDQPPIDLEPLAESVDPEALDKLVTPGQQREVTFSYLDHPVTVTDEEIEIAKPETADEA